MLFRSVSQSRYRKKLKERFDECVKDGYIRFVTFHQSFSYEDFVEGIRATVNADTKQTEYGIEDGVFKALCNDARDIKNTDDDDGRYAPISEQKSAYEPFPDFGEKPLNIVRRNPTIWKISLGAVGNTDINRLVGTDVI